jgi:hypothetical protein
MKAYRVKFSDRPNKLVVAVNREAAITKCIDQNIQKGETRTQMRSKITSCAIVDKIVKA